jgi:hypothetical protein
MLTIQRILAIAVLAKLSLVPARVSADALRTIKVTFKFDPGPTYGGVTWREPPYTTGLQGGSQVKVEARVEGIDDKGRPVKLAPKWTPADPKMVMVTPVVPGQLAHVMIVVKSAGQSRLKVAAEGLETELLVKAKAVTKGAMRVEFSR